MIWYEKGLNFKCTGCGKCCTGAPGHVWISEDEIRDMAQAIGIAPEDFVRRYVRLVGDRLALREIEREGEYDCIFLRENKCRIYENRPKQCRTFPWWSRNLESEQSWKEMASSCEGVDSPDSPHFSLEAIEKLLSS